MSDLQTQRQEIYDFVKNMLGGGMVEVELDPSHYETALTRTLGRYRQRSDNSVEESYIFLNTVLDQNSYTLANEIMEVKQLFRRSVGSRSGGGDGGTLFEPFNLAYTNTYLLSSSNLGGIATYNMFSQYQELVGRMFGSFIEFNWNPTKHMLTILQRPFATGEQVMLKTQNYRPDFVLLQDIYAKQWLYDYTLAVCKLMLGEARSKFASIAGPSSGIQMNGATLKTEGTAEITQLEKDIGDMIPGGTPMTFIIG